MRFKDTPMPDPTYDRAEIDSDPVWKAAFIMSECFNDDAPIGWSKYIPVAHFVIALSSMKDGERKSMIAAIGEHYCQHCGKDHYGQRHCQCWNDE